MFLMSCFFSLSLAVASCWVVSAAAVIHESGYEGKGVNITCHYDSQYESHEKYLCRGDCNHDADILVKSTETRKGRYSISDNKQKHVFVATISYLSAKDAGKYLCGVTKVGYDHFPSEVSLKVKQGNEGLQLNYKGLMKNKSFDLF